MRNPCYNLRISQTKGNNDCSRESDREIERFNDERKRELENEREKKEISNKRERGRCNKRFKETESARKGERERENESQMATHTPSLTPPHTLSERERERERERMREKERGDFPGVSLVFSTNNETSKVLIKLGNSKHQAYICPA